MRLIVTRPEMRFIRAYKHGIPGNLTLFWIHPVAGCGTDNMGYFHVGSVEAPDFAKVYYRIFCALVTDTSVVWTRLRRKGSDDAQAIVLIRAMEALARRYEDFLDWQEDPYSKDELTLFYKKVEPVILSEEKKCKRVRRVRSAAASCR